MSVYANGFTITHKGDGQVDTAAPPDVCKTPSPGGPVPIPYVNVAKSGDLADGSSSTEIEGNPAALESSSLSMSSGDEPGSAGGIISSKFKGKAGWATYSSDVKIEGKSVVRFSDVVQQNGNTYNTAFIQMGGTGFAYGDDAQCSLCNKPPEKHRVLDMVESSASEAAQILERMHANPSRFLAKKKRGFMVGVLVCNCQKWATTSGNTAPNFADAAPGCTIVEGGQVSAADLGGDNAEAVEALEGAFEQVMEYRQDPEIRHHYSYPGACAAAKLMNAASGHELRAMTEVYFSADRWRGNYHVETTSGAGTRTVPMSFREMTQADAGAGATNRSVASCESCQLILPFTLCQLEDWKC